VFGALLIPAGRAADRSGRKGIFMLGVTVFTVASAACAVSPALWALVAFRCVRAVGAAILVPSSLDLVLTTMPPDRVLRGVWGMGRQQCRRRLGRAGGRGPARAGGLALDLPGQPAFRSGHAGVGRASYPEASRAAAARVPSPAATASMIIAIGAMSLGVVEGPDWEWTDPRVLHAWWVCVGCYVAAAGVAAWLRGR
jgi:MFS family permease